MIRALAMIALCLLTAIRVPLTLDDGSADGSAGLVLKDDGVSGADIQVAVALVAVGVAGGGVALSLVAG